MHVLTCHPPIKLHTVTLEMSQNEICCACKKTYPEAKFGFPSTKPGPISRLNANNIKKYSAYFQLINPRIGDALCNSCYYQYIRSTPATTRKRRKRRKSKKKDASEEMEFSVLTTRKARMVSTVTCSVCSKLTSSDCCNMITKQNLEIYQQCFGLDDLETGPVCWTCFNEWCHYTANSGNSFNSTVSQIGKCCICQKADGQTKFGYPSKPRPVSRINEFNIDKYASFFDAKNLELGAPLCNSCYQAFAQKKGKKKIHLLEFSKKRKLNSEDEEEEEENTCVVCDVEFTAQTKFLEYQVDESNVVDFEECFEKDILFGNICKSCYTKFYTYYKQQNTQ